LTDKTGRTLQVPRRDVISIDSLTQVRSRGAMVKSGAVSGVIVGAIVGTVAGFLSYQEGEDWVSDSRIGSVAVFAVGGAALGGGIGALVGSTKSGEQWKQLWSNEIGSTR
jgi:hypothetical protein